MLARDCAARCQVRRCAPNVEIKQLPAEMKETRSGRYHAAEAPSKGLWPLAAGLWAVGGVSSLAELQLSVQG